MSDTSDKYSILLDRVKAFGTSSGHNIIAFSGGVDSSLVAHAVHEIFPNNSTACLAVSPSLSSVQYELARVVSHHIGIPLLEIETHEVENPDYIANEGTSCYHCKSELYSVMNSLYQHIGHRYNGSFVMFNGTNADDKLDPTRLGLKAADEFHVVSPLDIFSKQEVRELSKLTGLPNWNYAAAPCLRSRLQFGVEATPENLKRIEDAEKFIRTVLNLSPTDNLRVRHLTQIPRMRTARIEADDTVIERMKEYIGSIEDFFIKLGYSSVTFQTFRSGSLSRKLSS